MEAAAESHRFPRLVVNDKAAVRIARGHRWVFSNDVQKAPVDAVPGGEVAVFDPKEEFLGSALCNPHALLMARLYSRRSEAFDEILIRARIAESLARRERSQPGREAFRAVFSESDGLPGLVVDRYGPVVVFQLLTLSMEQRRDVIVAALKDLMTPECIVERSDVPARQHESLPERSEVVFGALPESLFVLINGISFSVDPLRGQKTGLFLDQAANWALVEGLAKGRKVLDLFSHAGGFSMHAARGGAEWVKAVDQSDDALSSLMLNAERNGLQRIRARNSDAFLYVRSRPDVFDLVICDPPPFARSRKQLEGALRGYRELNRHCMKLLEPGGILFTASCSAAVSGEDFDKMLAISARDAGRSFRVLPGGGQPADHAPLLAMPETNYLKARILEAVD